MEFKSLRNIEKTLRVQGQITLFGIVFLSLCAVVTRGARGKTTF